MSFFQKLALCRGLKFALPQNVTPIEIKASFEKAYWRLEPTLKNSEHKDLAKSSLKSIALNYSTCKPKRTPKSLQKAIKQLQRNRDIVITKPDKGSGVVVMDKTEYLQLLSEASIDDTSKFSTISDKKPKGRGRPPKYYHPLFEKEKEVNSVVRRILPKDTADTLCTKGSRLAHLYGLPKTHKKKLSVRPILSATATYNFALAKWLDSKLKPLSINEYTIADTFNFAREIQELTFNEDDIIVSYDVVSLFTNVPLDYTIGILVEKAFENNWFCNTYNLDITKQDLTDLLKVATKNQLFQFNDQLYVQTDGVAMGSPLGPLLANTFLCNVEECLERQHKLPSLYRRYVDDTLAVVKDRSQAEEFLIALNNCHPSVQFTLELPENGTLPFLGMRLEKQGTRIVTSVYRKSTNKGLLLHYQSHVDSRYKKSLLVTMVHRAHKLSSTADLFKEECKNIVSIFRKLQYPEDLIERAIEDFNDTSNDPQPSVNTNNNTDNSTIRFTVPFIDQKSADIVRRQLSQLNKKLNSDMQPVFTSQKLDDILKNREEKLPLVNQHLVVYNFQCGWCDASYVGYTARHLHTRVEEHRYSAIGKHRREDHGITTAPPMQNFKVLKKCKTKFDCLIYEMLLIKERSPKLNTQSDSVKAKLFA